MALAAFDTLEFVDELEKAGIPEKEARAISSAVRRSHESLDVATKADLEKLSLELRHDMDAKFASVDAKFERLNAKLDKMLLQLTVRLGGVIVATLTVLSLLPKIFH